MASFPDDVSARHHLLWRALTYLAAAQLYLRGNVTGDRPLQAGDLTPSPAGHWGTVPPVAWALAGLAVQDIPVRPVIGAGHAGIVQRGYAWLTGVLGELRPRYARTRTGLEALCADFPHCDGLGAEIHPQLPAGSYVGGQLGPALAFAQAAAGGHEVVMPIIGDGEAETGETAAAWLADPVIRPRAESTPMLPILNLNGLRMGSPSLLGTRAAREVDAYLAGTGWRTRWAHVHTASLDEARQFGHVLAQALEAVCTGERLALVLDMPKGLTGPGAGTPACHKTPLPDPATDPQQLDELRRWLGSYQPQRLFTTAGAPRRELVDALPRWPTTPPPQPSASPRPVETEPGTWARAAEDVLRTHAERGLRVFSPDELASNRLGGLTGERWVTEVLNEPLLAAWLLGHCATGQPGVVITYEAFAPLMHTALTQHAKTLRLTAERHRWPSANAVVTSLGWRNCYTHGDPSLVTTLLGLADPAIRVYTPADPRRAAAQLDRLLADTGQINLLVVDKHGPAHGPADTINAELDHGWATWHEPDTPPQIVLVSVGDLAAAQLTTIRAQLDVPARHVHVHEPAVLGDPGRWPQAIPHQQWARVFPPELPMLVVTTGQPAALWPLLGPRGHRWLDIRGWREPTAPMPEAELLRWSGMDTPSLTSAAHRAERTAREAM